MADRKITFNAPDGRVHVAPEWVLKAYEENRIPDRKNVRRVYISMAIMYMSAFTAGYFSSSFYLGFIFTGLFLLFDIGYVKLRKFIKETWKINI